MPEDGANILDFGIVMSHYRCISTVPKCGAGRSLPFDFFNDLAESGPLRRMSLASGETVWAVLRPHVMRKLLADSRLSRVPGGHIEQHSVMLLRRLAVHSLSIENLSGILAEVDGQILDCYGRIREVKTVDLVTDFAMPVAGASFCILFGLPRSDWPTFLKFAWAVTPLGLDRELGITKDDALKWLRIYLEEIVVSYWEASASEFQKAAVSACNISGATPQELAECLLMLIIAGNDSLANIISSSLLTILDSPEIVVDLSENSRKLADSVEELIRLDSPVYPGVLRYVVSEIKIGELTLLPGELVLFPIAAAGRALAGSANYLPALSRNGRPNHLAFGYGPHFCPGAGFARQVLLRSIRCFSSNSFNAVLPLAHITAVWSDRSVRALRSLRVSRDFAV